MTINFDNILNAIHELGEQFPKSSIAAILSTRQLVYPGFIGQFKEGDQRVIIIHSSTLDEFIKHYFTIKESNDFPAGQLGAISAIPVIEDDARVKRILLDGFSNWMYELNTKNLFRFNHQFGVGSWEHCAPYIPTGTGNNGKKEN